MTVKKDEALKYLTDLRSYYGTYHNHKETSAWAIIAFSVLLAGPGVTTLAGITDGSLPLRVVATFVLIAMLYAAFVFLMQQFRSRRYAANVVAACNYWLAKVLIAEENKLSAIDFSLPVASDDQTHAEMTLPTCIQSKAKELGRKGKDAIEKMEGSGYVLLIFLFLLVIVRIWICPERA